MPEVTQPVEPECLLGRGFFPLAPVMGRGASWPPRPGGHAGVGETRPVSREGSIQHFGTQLWGGLRVSTPRGGAERAGDSCGPVSLDGALALPGAPSRLQMPRLSHFPPTPEVAEPIIPIFDVSKPKLPKAGTCSRSHIRTLDSKSPIGRGIGASQPPASPFPVSGHSPRGPCPRPDSPTLALIPQGISEQRSKEVKKQSTQRTG